MQVSRFVTATVVVAAMLEMGCSTPLSLRGARVLEPGEVEVIVSPQVQIPTVISTTGTPASLTLPTYGWAEGSVRFGVAERLDMQLRIDPSIIPEISIGYQLIGDPARDDEFALTFTAGIKPTFVLVASYVNLPLMLLVDIPINDTLGVTGGLRVIPNVLSVIGGQGGNLFGVAPGLVAGLRVKTGPFVFQPEIGVSANLPIGASAGGQSINFIGAGVGVAFVAATIGLNIGGQFDLRPVTVAPAPVAPAAPAVAPAPAPYVAPVQAAPEPLAAPPAPVAPADDSPVHSY